MVKAAALAVREILPGIFKIWKLFPCLFFKIMDLQMIQTLTNSYLIA